MKVNSFQTSSDCLPGIYRAGKVAYLRKIPAVNLIRPMKGLRLLGYVVVKSGSDYPGLKGRRNILPSHIP